MFTRVSEATTTEATSRTENTNRTLVAAIHRAGAADVNQKRNADLNRGAEDR